MQLVTILLDTKASPSQVEDLARELAAELQDRIEEETGEECEFDDCGVAVTEVRY